MSLYLISICWLVTALFASNNKVEQDLNPLENSLPLSNTYFSLLEFPPEIKGHILSCLDKEDKKNFSSVCCDFFSLTKENIQEIKIHLKKGITTQNVMDSLSKFQRLENITLHQEEKIDQNTFNEIVAYASKFRNLVFDNCDMITSNTIEQLSLSKNLQHLELNPGSDVEDADLIPFALLKNLTSLVINGCIKDSRPSVVGAPPLSASKTMTYLALRCCTYITDRGLMHLAPMLRGLTHLDLTAGYRIDDEALEHLAPLLRSLTHLDLSVCKYITDAGIAHLSPLKNLTHLGLRSCRSITDNGLRHLASFINLTYLDLRDCNNITPIGIQELKNRLPHLTIQQ